MLRHLRLPLVLAVALATLAAVIGGGASPTAPVADAASDPAMKLTSVLSARLTAQEGTTEKACHTSFRPGTAGIATRTVTAPGAGLVEATLDGASGDWDLAVFDARGKAIAADATPDAQEVASGWTVAAGELRVQACRLSGDADSAQVEIKHAPLPTDASVARSDPPQLINVLTPTRGHKDRVTALGLDMTEHGGTESVGVVLHGEADREKLRRAGLQWRVKVPDLVEQSLQQGAQQARAASGTRSDLPSGRKDTYRTLADYNNEMKELAKANPDLVKLIVLPFKTLSNREVMALEITKNVQANDGKPVFFNMGVHHAREWPSGEHAMEWAYELINGFKAGDQRIVNIMEKGRYLVQPLVNPDGFNASRSAGAVSEGDGGRDEAVDDTAYLVAGAGSGGEYRRKNCRNLDDSDGANCATSAGLAEPGVDPNRNYGGLWGGPGADAGRDASGRATQTYRGKAPFSERETQNVKALVGDNQVTTLITNHTTAGLLLRAPGVALLGEPVDELRGYKALGDAMAKENGYFSQNSFELYDTTGTTEDWTYNTAGGFGFTFEIYCGEPNFETGDCDDPAFHPLFATQAAEYMGDSDQNNHKDDPGFDAETSPFGSAPGFDGKGNREAYLIAAESTINEARHSIIEGEAPAGVTLRLKKVFKTETFPQPQPDGSLKPILFDDKLETTYTVDGSGKFRWHTNPSTRPIVAKERGEREGGEPSPTQKTDGGPQGSSETADGTDDGAATPSPAPPDTTTTASYNDHPFQIPAGGANSSANVRVVWSTPTTDWDIELFEDVDGNGKSNAGDKSVGVSAQGATSEEETGITGKTDPATGKVRLVPNKKYVLRVSNFSAVEPYDVFVIFNGPEAFQPAQVESYTMTCERDGQVLDTQEVVVDRGQVKPVTLGGGCARAAGTQPSDPSGQTTTGTTPTPTPTPATKACVAGGGFSAVSASARGRGARLGFTRKVSRPVTVSVFQQSSGRRITGERLVARFSNRTKTFNWTGKANRKGRKVTDGYYFVRYTVATPGGQADVRRLTLERRRGKFVKRPDFYRRAACDRLPSFKLERPVFGGRTNRPLNLSFRLATPARVTVTVLRGSRVVKRFGPTQRRTGVTHRLRLESKNLGRGEYRVRISVPGGKTLTSTLVGRRI